MQHDYHKYQALGNDYIVIDPQENDLDLTAGRIKRICSRHFGIGSDGILYGPLFDDQHHIKVRIFNPDGSEAEKSGNGVREFSRYLKDAGYVTSTSYELKTLGGPVAVTFLDAQAHNISVAMGQASFSSPAIPTTFPAAEALRQPLAINGQCYAATCVSIGNPHCVIPVAEATAALAQALGPCIETDPHFPHKTNVQLLEVIDRHDIRIEIWERGAGYTLASGTSSCAAAAAAYRLGLAGPELDVHMPGGIIHIEISPDWHIQMTGTVSAVAHGDFAADFLASL